MANNLSLAVSTPVWNSELNCFTFKVDIFDIVGNLINSSELVAKSSDPEIINETVTKHLIYFKSSLLG